MYWENTSTGRLGCVARSAEGCPQALVRKRWRHADIGDDHVHALVRGKLAVHLGDEALAVAHGRHFVTAACEQGNEAIPEQRQILGDDDAQR